jgi:hypothetical protein
VTDPLTKIFEDFRAEVAPQVRPIGTGSARQTVRKRRQRRTAAAGVLAALVVAVPIAIGAVVGTHGTPGVTEATPRSTPSTEYFIPPGQNTEPSARAPQGAISEAALYRSKLNLPAWTDNAKCPAGPVQFADGKTVSGQDNVWLSKVAYADVDHDGTDETFVRVFCLGPDLAMTSQVIGLTASAHGDVRTLGQVTAQGGTIAGVCDLRAGSDGAIEAQVTDFPVPWRCADSTLAAERYVTTQWRTFSWTGSAFVQSGGPIQFEPNAYATDLALSSSHLVLNRQSDGHYRGELTLTVHNLGASAIPYRTQTLLSDGMRLVDPPQGCTVHRESNGGGGIEDLFCTGAKLPGGTSRSVTLKIDSPKLYRVDNWQPQTDAIPLDGYNDPQDANNSAALAIQFRD